LIRKRWKFFALAGKRIKSSCAASDWGIVVDLKGIIDGPVNRAIGPSFKFRIYERFMVATKIMAVKKIDDLLQV